MDKLEQMFWILMLMALVVEVPDMSKRKRKVMSGGFSLLAIAAFTVKVFS